MRVSMGLALLAVVLGTGTALAAGSGLVFVSNEKGNTISVLDRAGNPVSTFEACRRPRGMVFSTDRTLLFVACGDDESIVAYDVATQRVRKRIRPVPYPETFALHPDGRHLYVSNEEDSAASVYDIETGDLVYDVETGPEPEGVAITADGRLAFVASEAANLVHVIDTAKRAVVADIPVDTRPRRFAFTPDQKELWVSAELAGVVNIIDVATLKRVADVPFQPPGLKRDQVTPVDLAITADGTRAYVALGRANHVAVVDVPTRRVVKYILVGRRAWGLRLTADEKRLFVANGLSDDVSLVETDTLTVSRSVPVGMVPYAILVDDR